MAPTYRFVGGLIIGFLAVIQAFILLEAFHLVPWNGHAPGRRTGRFAGWSSSPRVTARPAELVDRHPPHDLDVIQRNRLVPNASRRRANWRADEAGSAFRQYRPLHIVGGVHHRGGNRRVDGRPRRGVLLVLPSVNREHERTSYRGNARQAYCRPMRRKRLALNGRPDGPAVPGLGP